MTTFATIRTQHADTLRRCNAGPITPEIVKEVEGFIETVRLAGREIADEDDREYLRSLLTFWGNWYYNQTRTYPNTNLELASADVAAAYAREEVNKLVTGKATDSRTQNRLVMGIVVVMLGLVGLVALAALAVAALPIMFGGAQAGPTTPPNIAVEETVAAISSATADALIVELTEQVPATELANATLEILPGTTATPFIAAATPLPLPSATLPPASPTASGAGDEPTPTIIPGIGGGGFTPSIGFLSVQIVEPSISASLTTNQPFNIGAAYSNLQPGWTLFYVVNGFYSNETLVMPGSFEVGLFNTTGVWTESVLLQQPGLYNISVYIATTTDSRAVLQRYADAGASLPPDINLEGVITFYGLTAIQVN